MNTYRSIIICLICSVTASQAADIYVGPAGSDLNRGGAGEPLA